MKKVTLFAVLTFFVQPAIAAPIVSQLLIDRAEKSVLDCLDYSSKMNCDKAAGALESVRISANQAYEERKVGAACALNASTLKVDVFLVAIGDKSGQSGLLSVLSRLRASCLNSK